MAGFATLLIPAMAKTALLRSTFDLHLEVLSFFFQVPQQAHDLVKIPSQRLP